MAWWNRQPEETDLNATLADMLVKPTSGGPPPRQARWLRVAVAESGERLEFVVRPDFAPLPTAISVAAGVILPSSLLVIEDLAGYQTLLPSAGTVFSLSPVFDLDDDAPEPAWDPAWGDA